MPRLTIAVSVKFGNVTVMPKMNETFRKKFHCCQNYKGVNLDALQNLTGLINGENLENVKVVTIQTVGEK